MIDTTNNQSVRSLNNHRIRLQDIPKLVSTKLTKHQLLILNDWIDKGFEYDKSYNLAYSNLEVFDFDDEQINHFKSLEMPEFLDVIDELG